MEDSTSTPAQDTPQLGNSSVASSSDVDMRNSTVIIRDSASMQHESRPLAHSRTVYMEVDPGPTATHDAHLQTTFESEHHIRKRSGFDRISELEGELANRDQKLYSFSSEMTLKSHEIANLRAQISRLESDAQDLQDSLSAQRQQNEGAWASASTKESINQELMKKNTELVNKIQDQDKKLKDFNDGQLSEEKDIKSPKNTGTESIQKLETECHALKVQITALQESNWRLSRVNKELETTKQSFEQSNIQSQGSILQLSLAKSVHKCQELETNIKDLQDTVKSLAEAKSNLENLSHLATSEISTLKADCTSLRRELADQEQVTNNTRDELSQRIDNLQTENASLITVKASLLEDIEEMTIEAGEKAIEAAQEVEKIKEKERMATKKVHEIANALEEDNQQLLNDHGLLKEDHEHSQEELRKVKDQLKQTETEKLETETRLTRAQDRLDQLGRETLVVTQESEQREHKLQAEIDGLKTRCNDLVTKIQELDLQNTSLSRESEKQKRELETEIGDLKTKCSDLDTKIQQSNIENTTLSRKSEQQEQGLQAEIDGLKTKCSDLDTKRLELDIQNATLSRELEQSKRKLQNEIDGLTTRYNTLDNSLKQTVGEKVTLSRDLEQQKRELSDEVTSSTTKYSALDKKLQQVEREKAALSREGEQQRQELQDNIDGLKTEIQQLATEKQGLRGDRGDDWVPRQKHEEANSKLTQKERELTAKVNESNVIQTNFEVGLIRCGTYSNN
ncbi:hypothetical protein EV368DRAFT_70151 [Lentinula lateritia]|nr:hypothetical protein EV368DRAFT_70151 [Lentinula lateritia]